MFKKLALSALFLVAFVSLVSVEAFAQTAEAESANIDQCRNGKDVANDVKCEVIAGGNLGWVNGNAGDNNSHWQENQFISYRMLLQGLATGTTQHELIIGYDTFHVQGQSRTHAIDYLGNYNATETDADPCSGVIGAHCQVGPSSYEPFDEDTTVTSQINPNTGQPIVQIPGGLSMWGGTILSVEYVPGYDPATDDERQVRIIFTTTVSNPVFAWGGHIAWAGDWGLGNSSGAIQGSPYHMRLGDLNGSGGNQDLQLSADAIDVTGAIIIIKEVVTVDGTNQSEDLFNFTAASNFNPLNFALEDDDDPNDQDQVGDPNPQDRKISNAVFNLGSPIRVTELATAGYTTLNIECRDQNGALDANSNTSIVLGTPGNPSYVDVVVDQINTTTAQFVTCTFTNGKLTASAGPVEVGGRVVDKRGKAISGATVTVTDLNLGEEYSVKTDKFGYYRFPTLVIDETYTVRASYRNLQFNEHDPFGLEDNALNVNFQAK